MTFSALKIKVNKYIKIEKIPIVIVLENGYTYDEGKSVKIFFCLSGQ